MSWEYYLAREDNRTLFDLDKAYTFAEFWGCGYNKEYEEFTVDPRCAPFLRSLEEQCREWGLDFEWVHEMIDYFSEDKPLRLFSSDCWSKYQGSGYTQESSIWDPRSSPHL